MQPDLNVPGTSTDDPWSNTTNVNKTNSTNSTATPVRPNPTPGKKPGKKSL